MSKISEEEIRRHLELLSQIQPSVQSADRAIQRVRRVLTEYEQSPKIQNISIWRIIMKSPITKLAVAAAVVVIAALITINLFGGGVTNVAWAEITERFESVPFFSLTIYIGYDMSAQARKIEIWKSEDGRVRAHDGNNVIFADFSGGKNVVLAFDRTTKQPVPENPYDLARMFIGILCPDGRFSLETLVKSFPSETQGMAPVEIENTAAAKETIVFEVKHQTTPERLLIWALRESKLPTRVRFQDPRNHECGDFVFDYSEKKDAAFFDPNTFREQ